jgi:hypothetical protein
VTDTLGRWARAYELQLSDPDRDRRRVAAVAVASDGLGGGFARLESAGHGGLVLQLLEVSDA